MKSENGEKDFNQFLVYVRVWVDERKFLSKAFQAWMGTIVVWNWRRNDERCRDNAKTRWFSSMRNWFCCCWKIHLQCTCTWSYKIWERRRSNNKNKEKSVTRGTYSTMPRATCSHKNCIVFGWIHQTLPAQQRPTFLILYFQFLLRRKTNFTICESCNEETDCKLQCFVCVWVVCVQHTRHSYFVILNRKTFVAFCCPFSMCWFGKSLLISVDGDKIACWTNGSIRRKFT